MLTFLYLDFCDVGPKVELEFWGSLVVSGGTRKLFVNEIVVETGGKAVMIFSQNILSRLSKNHPLEVLSLLDVSDLETGLPK